MLAKDGVHYANLINANDKLRPLISKLSIKLTLGCYRGYLVDGPYIKKFIVKHHMKKDLKLRTGL